MKILRYVHVMVLLCNVLFSLQLAQANERKQNLDIAYINSIPPYIYEVNGVTTGIIIQSLQSMLGEDFSLKVLYTSPKELQRSAIPALLGTSPSIKDFPFVKAFTVTTIPLSLFYKGDVIDNIEKAQSLNIGYVDFGFPLSTLQSYYPMLSITMYATLDSLLDALKKGTIQGAILPDATLSFITQEHIKQFMEPLAYIGVNLYVKKDNTALLNAITSAFVQRLMQEQIEQSPMTAYGVIGLLGCILLGIVCMVYTRKQTSHKETVLHTTMELTREVFLDHFLCTITESGTILSVSSGITNILGYAPNAIVGKNIKELQKDAFPCTLPTKGEMAQYTLMHVNGSLIPLVFFPVNVTTKENDEHEYECIVFTIGQLVERQEYAFSVLSLYQTMFATSPVGIVRYDIENECFVYMNPVFEKMMHKDATELMPSSLQDIIGAQAEHIIKKARGGRVDTTISLQCEGEEKWFLLYINGIHIAYKYYLDMFFIDITQGYKSKRDTEESYAYLSKIFDILPYPTFVLDKDKTIIIWNKALEELTGVSSKVMLGKNDGSYSLPFYGSLRKMLCDTFYEDDALEEGDTPIQQNAIGIEAFCPALGNGKYLWISTTALRESDGKPYAVIQTMQDITESKEIVTALEQSKERYIMVLEASNKGIWEVDCATYSIHASEKCYDILGIEKGIRLDYTSLFSYVYPEYQEDLASRMKLLREGRIDTTEFIFRMLTPDNAVKWIQSSVFVNKNTGGDVVSIIGSLADITESKEHENITRIIFLISNAVNIAREPKELFQAIHSILTRYVGYSNLIVALWNEQESSMEYPYYYDEVYNKEEYIAHAHTKEDAPRPIADVFSAGSQLVITEHIERNGVEEEWVWLATPLRVLDTIIGVIATHKLHATQQAIESIYSKNDKELMIAIGEQIGIAIERYNSKEQLTAMALHDPLTGLPNRVLFSDRLDHAIRRVNRSAEYRFAVFMLDLDRFKLINDTYGHNTGDLLLIEVANRIQPLLRSEDTFARLGGDEFAIILENIRSTHEVLAVAKRILRAIEQPLIIEGKELKTATSIGIVLDASSYDSAHTLLRDADIAMYDAKTNGKGRFRVFDQAMHQQMLEYVSLENELNNTIENNELFLEYQPIIDVETRGLVGFEALVRWRHPEKGVIYPNKFINIAEENGFITKLGMWVLEEACRVMKGWVDASPELSNLSISVNLSAKQAVQSNLTSTVMEVINRIGIPPQQVNLEVTETTIMKDPKNAKTSFEELRAQGVHISIDDFGSGYSSMTYLQRFPVDVLKIDRTFIQNASIEDGSVEIVRAICALAHGLGMHVIAEGVETEEQLDIVKECKCDYIQGFLFSRPLSEEHAFSYIQEHVQGGVL